MNDYLAFSEWLNKVLEQKLPTGIVAFNFNLYEGEDTYDIQLIGSDQFNDGDCDWACSEIFTTSENVYLVKKTPEITEWEAGFEYIKPMVETYLQEGKYKHILLKSVADGLGFIDGDIFILHQSI